MVSTNVDNKVIADGVAVIAIQHSDKQLLSDMLSKAGYDAKVFDTSDSLNARNVKHDAVIICHRRNRAGSVPTLPQSVGGQRVVVFSDCTEEHTIVGALENGAHHFFDLKEPTSILQARLEAALRQHALHAKRILEVAPFEFNLERRSVYKDGKLINLSPKEYEFAHYLFANRHRVIVNTELMTSVWSLPSSMDARRIDTAACRVRKKMQLGETSTGWSLRRIRRVGYELMWLGECKQPNSGITAKTLLEDFDAANSNPTPAITLVQPSGQVQPSEQVQPSKDKTTPETETAESA